MNKKQSGILSFLKKPKDTESVNLTTFRPDLPSPKPVTTKQKASELSSPNSTPSKRRHIYAWPFIIIMVYIELRGIKIQV